MAARDVRARRRPAPMAASAAAVGPPPQPPPQDTTDAQPRQDPAAGAEAALMERLQGLGFSEERARAALLLHSNHLCVATDWLLEQSAGLNVGGPRASSAATEETPEESGRAATNLAAASPLADIPPRTEGSYGQALLQLVEMGFDEEQARAALHITSHNAEDACMLLLGDHVLPPAPPPDLGTVAQECQLAAAAGVGQAASSDGATSNTRESQQGEGLLGSDNGDVPSADQPGRTPTQGLSVACRTTATDADAMPSAPPATCTSASADEGN
eukprot:SM000134S26925  [mRNA]  locus=s134:46658:48052:+ [translate_table: standard]